MRKTKKLVFAGLCTALGVALPIAFHAIPNAGGIFLPMHIPVLLCGLLLGPVRGGLAAGIGSMIFDLMTPEYAPEAWITFLRFFLMAWLCGVIAYAGAAAAKKFARNLVACLAGAVFSSLLYMLKGIIELMIGGSALVPAFVANIPKLMTSPPNIVIAVVVAMALLPALQKAMNSTSFGRHMAEK